MGICSSSQITRRGGSMKLPPKAMVIGLDGGLQEFKSPIKACYILSQNPNCFLCSSETMFIGSHVPHVTDDEELQLGQIYFLMPISKSQTPLSLQDLCALAIKASTALNNLIFQPFLAGHQLGCEVPDRFDMAEMGSQAVEHGSRRTNLDQQPQGW
ncbi:Mitochondrial fission regulator like [Actinidia chinensis var. chinensis]|uniref:Mitochondrial fission regulator like n=1 Tax=Actinidia chinensis var. chinensis TaxID=1590841 RepID=A0A2R6RH96_ACTCC|nr:Mitochondrial fission regulator like [Actinidia chinensis var. chinensis]